MKILVTGAAGFIGYHLSERLLARGDEVVGLDNFNDYYDVSLKEARAARLAARNGFRMQRGEIADRESVNALFRQEGFDRVVHLAEAARQAKVSHLVYASSSSVYGSNHKIPFSEDDPVDHPMSLYAATKRANELMAHTYSHLFALPTTGLRFFTVYGPWGRPDMALFKFTRAILAGETLQVFNNGEMIRDFTFIDDIIEGVVRSAAGRRQL
jgi:UDP-glucuronate 4-epimerase